MSKAKKNELSTVLSKPANRNIEEVSRRRTEDKSVRKAQLIEATIDCIAKYGIAGTTLARVTEIAGLSLGLVSFHFDSKERLLEETLRYVATEYNDHWRKVNKIESKNDTERLLAIIDSTFDAKICNRKKLSVWFAFIGEHGGSATYRKIVEDLDTDRYYEIIRLLTSITAGKIESDLSFVVYNIETLMDGLWMSILLYPKEVDREYSKYIVKRNLFALLPGCFDETQLLKEQS
jgi:TetR/AcrR family transcriptional regulator, transcriptional repressor of bet genes